MKIRGHKNDPLMAVDVPTFGTLYHVAWGWSRGIVGRCISIDKVNKTVILRSPKTKRDWANPVKWSDLRHTRTNAYKISKSNPK